MVSGWLCEGEEKSFSFFSFLFFFPFSFQKGNKFLKKGNKIFPAKNFFFPPKNFSSFLLPSTRFSSARYVLLFSLSVSFFFSLLFFFLLFLMRLFSLHPGTSPSSSASSSSSASLPPPSASLLFHSIAPSSSPGPSFCPSPTTPHLHIFTHLHIHTSSHSHLLLRQRLHLIFISPHQNQVLTLYLSLSLLFVFLSSFIHHFSITTSPRQSPLQYPPTPLLHPLLHSTSEFFFLPFFSFSFFFSQEDKTDNISFIPLQVLSGRAGLFLSFFLFYLSFFFFFSFFFLFLYFCIFPFRRINDRLHHPSGTFLFTCKIKYAQNMHHGTNLTCTVIISVTCCYMSDTCQIHVCRTCFSLIDFSFGVLSGNMVYKGPKLPPHSTLNVGEERDPAALWCSQKETEEEQGEPPGSAWSL